MMGWNIYCYSLTPWNNLMKIKIVSIDIQKWGQKENVGKSHKENRNALKFKPGYFTILKNIITAKMLPFIVSLWMRIPVPLFNQILEIQTLTKILEGLLRAMPFRIHMMLLKSFCLLPDQYLKIFPIYGGSFFIFFFTFVTVKYHSSKLLPGLNCLHIFPAILPQLFPSASESL